jgi:hypothetical protein
MLNTLSYLDSNTRIWVFPPLLLKKKLTSISGYITLSQNFSGKRLMEPHPPPNLPLEEGGAKKAPSEKKGK